MSRLLEAHSAYRAIPFGKRASAGENQGRSDGGDVVLRARTVGSMSRHMSWPIRLYYCESDPVVPWLNRNLPERLGNDPEGITRLVVPY